MAQIIFNQNVDFAGFNLGSSDISYPEDQSDPVLIDNATENSILYSFVNDILCDDDMIYARYKSTTLARDKFIIYRQTIDDNIKTYLGTINGVTDGFYDYDIVNNKQYKYTVETNPGDTDDAPSVSLELDHYLNPHWNYWSICDIEKDYEASEESQRDIYVPSDKVFIIKNNINVGAISDNLNIIKYNTLGRFGKTISNQQKYDSGSMSCLIADMMAYQDIRYSDKVFVNNDYSTIEEINNFFIKLDEYQQGNTQNFYGHYFLFPKFSNKYFQYNPNWAKEIYIQMEREPDNWEDTFNMYYVKNNNDKYIVPTYRYIVLTEMPSDWDTKYDTYYTFGEADGEYILNTDPEWPEQVEGEYKYFKREAPIWQSDTYYIKAISCGTEIVSQNIFMNTYDMLSAWRECLSNGKLKLLKAPNGQSWVVTISDPTQLNVNWNAKQYPSSIDFNWQEVLDKNKISIIKW